MQTSKTSAWAVPLYPKMQKAEAAIATTLPRKCAWDVPLIPKIITARDACANISNLENSHSEAKASVITIPGNIKTASPLSATDIETASTLSTTDIETASSSSTTDISEKKRNRRRQHAYFYYGKQKHGLFIAEMSNGLHVSLGQCWATAHYHNGTPPVYVVHMPVAMRKK
jgi:hypothetical protein